LMALIAVLLIRFSPKPDFQSPQVSTSNLSIYSWQFQSFFFFLQFQSIWMLIPSIFGWSFWFSGQLNSGRRYYYCYLINISSCCCLFFSETVHCRGIGLVQWEWWRVTHPFRNSWVLSLSPSMNLLLVCVRTY